MKEFNQIKTRNELADFLNIPRKQLSYVLYVKGINNLYNSFKIRKKNGGFREINAPLEELKGIQRRLQEVLYKKIGNKWINRNISHGFERNRSIITNAIVHRNKRIVLNIDLENFFESIHFGRVRGFFNKNKNFSLPIDVATVIAQIACYEGRLPQGAPSSPIISNLICEILDYRLLKIAKKYKVNYTRYADDLTFSTNDKNFLFLQREFYEEISHELIRTGFKINEKKNRLQLRDSRQVVTGLVVNKKINVNRIYYKETRAMAYQLYKQGSFKINDEPATINQLEGRFAFINQLTWHNNLVDGITANFNNFTSREQQYQRFLFYKYFFANSKPVIVTEGKTDVRYLKSALKSLYKDYPKLIVKHKDGSFEFKIHFLKKTKRLSYFLGIYKDGGNALNNIYQFFGSKNSKLNYLNYFKKISGNSPENPVILLFDNEIKSGNKKPIGKFLNYAGLDDEKKTTLKKENMVNIVDSLYLLTVPLINGKLECDIEDLFDNNTLFLKIEGKEFSKKDSYDVSKYYGKEIFSQHISQNYSDINFNQFRPVLDNINKIIDVYTRQNDNMLVNLELKKVDKRNMNKVELFK